MDWTRVFEIVLRVGMERIRLPRWFYELWGHELHHTVYIEDEYLNHTFRCTLEFTNGAAFLRTDMNQIRATYAITGDALITLAYRGESRFSCFIPFQGGKENTPMNETTDLVGKDDESDTESMKEGSVSTVSVVEIDGTSTEILFGGESETDTLSVVQNVGTVDETCRECHVQMEDVCEDDDAPSLLWTSKMTDNLAGGRYLLLIPVRIAKTVFHDRPSHVRVMMPDGVVNTWNLAWGGDERLPWKFWFGLSWFEFLHEYPVRIGDDVSFWKKDNEDVIRIKITHM